jgi:hypothetical protein
MSRFSDDNNASGPLITARPFSLAARIPASAAYSSRSRSDRGRTRRPVPRYRHRGTAFAEDAPLQDRDPGHLPDRVLIDVHPARTGPVHPDRVRHSRGSYGKLESVRPDTSRFTGLQVADGNHPHLPYAPTSREPASDLGRRTEVRLRGGRDQMARAATGSVHRHAAAMSVWPIGVVRAGIPRLGSACQPWSIFFDRPLSLDSRPVRGS